MKLVGPEAESGALKAYLLEWPRRASSGLLLVEVMRAARKLGDEATRTARERLEGMILITIERPLLERAATIGPQILRSLDAIHLATAQQLGPDLGVLVTYDRRLAQAATELGMPVAAPA